MSFNFAESFGFDFNAPQASQISVQPPVMNTPQLEDELPELLKHPSVMFLWCQNQALQVSQNKLTDTTVALQQNNLALQNQLQSLKTELLTANQKVSTLAAEIQSIQVNANL
jgi:hypothetical protein